MSKDPAPFSQLPRAPLANQGVIRVLLIEDNPGDQRLAQIYLSEDPHFPVETDCAESLEAGLSKIEASDTYDVILLDLTLPDSTGFDTFDRLNQRVPDTPIVVLSGQDDEILARQIVHHGGQDSLPKDLMSGPLMRRTIGHAMERKSILRELRSTQMQLIQAEKMDSIGRLAAGVAHEVKNPLARILMGIDYLSNDLDPNDPNLPVVLKRMEDAVQRAETIIKGMLNFASDRQLTLSAIDPNSLIEGVLILIHHELKSRQVKLTLQLSHDLPKVNVDSSKMEQALINVLTNALQAMDLNEPESTLTIGTYQNVLKDHPLDQGARTKHHLRSGDDVVVFEIDDNGPGITQEALDKLYDPFFTTKPTGVGTGLGLTVSRKIIDLHHGLITLTNREEGGTRTRIILKAV